MVRETAAFALLGLMAFLPAASAHGALAVNELETYAISDFEGQEDSFAWEGWEIWDVYVGEGYSEAHSSDGVYFKVNLAGDGTSRPSGGQTWTVTFTFTIADQAFQRQIAHDGVDVTTDFEELEWQIADGNVFQVRAWVPVAAWEGQSVTDLVLVSTVDGEPRDTAPGGIHLPGTGTEVPVEAPPTQVFPAMGEGRLVETIPLTGPAKFIDVSIQSLGNGTFDLTVTNPLQEQGQHVLFHPTVAAGWTVAPAEWNSNLEAGQTVTLRADVRPTTADGSMVEPVRFDLLTDIGGRQTFQAYVEAGEILVTDDAAAAQAAAYGEVPKEAPAAPVSVLLIAFALAIGLRPKARGR